jgi:hypothetical protein
MTAPALPSPCLKCRRRHSDIVDAVLEMSLSSKDEVGIPLRDEEGPDGGAKPLGRFYARKGAKQLGSAMRPPLPRLAGAVSLRLVAFEMAARSIRMSLLAVP